MATGVGALRRALVGSLSTLASGYPTRFWEAPDSEPTRGIYGMRCFSPRRDGSVLSGAVYFEGGFGGSLGDGGTLPAWLPVIPYIDKPDEDDERRLLLRELREILRRRRRARLFRAGVSVRTATRSCLGPAVRAEVRNLGRM